MPHPVGSCRGRLCVAAPRAAPPAASARVQVVCTGRGRDRTPRPAGPAPPRAHPDAWPGPRRAARAGSPRRPGCPGRAACGPACGPAEPGRHVPGASARRRLRPPAAAATPPAWSPARTSSSGCAATMTVLAAQPDWPGAGERAQPHGRAGSLSSVPGALNRRRLVARVTTCGLPDALRVAWSRAPRDAGAGRRRQIGDRAGMRLIVAEGCAPSARPCSRQHVGGDRLLWSARAPAGLAAIPRRAGHPVSVDFVGRLVERGPHRVQPEHSIPQMSERVRSDIALGRGAEQRPRHAAGAPRPPPRRRRG